MSAPVSRSPRTVVFRREQLFRTQDVELFPAEIECLVDIPQMDAEIDVIVTSHRFPKLTNVTLENYLLRERNPKVRILVVESSADEGVFDELLRHERVGRILIRKDILIKGKIHGYGSYGMALSSAIGATLSTAPCVFFSHSDMVGCRDGFLTFLRSKLKDGVRLASFTQRHMIPFTGSMMVSRDLLEEKNLDWLPLDQNPFLRGHALEGLLPENRLLGQVDCGEQYIFSELAQGRPMHVCASRGGSLDWWKDPLDYFPTPVQVLWDKLHVATDKICFAKLAADRDGFSREHAGLLKAGRDKWYFFEKPKWWRYCFDDDGRLAFIHYGRGTTLRAAKRWIGYWQEQNARLSKESGGLQ